MTFLTGMFVVILAGMALGAIAEISKAIVRRTAAPPELARIKEQLEQVTAALEEAQHALANQSGEIAELQERVDFAERLLTQVRERAALNAGKVGS